jgi:hypothetical protein
MYDQIVIDCQTKKEPICCEYCGAKMKCSLRFEVTESQKMQKEPSKLLVPIFLIDPVSIMIKN